MKNLFNAEAFTSFLEKLQEWVLTELPIIILITVILLIVLRVVKLFIRKLKKTLIRRAEKNQDRDTEEAEKRILTLTGILRSIIKILLVATYLLIILQKLGINIAPILASAGIVGLAVGFGAQELVRDVISGFFILLENQVRAGDVAIINGTGGLVEKIELRTITLRDFSGVVHVVQNGKINSMSNMTKEWSAIVFEIGVAYKENVDRVMEIMKETGEELIKDEVFGQKIIDPIEIFGLDSFGDSALIIKARLKTKPITQWEVGREYRRRLKIAFDKNNIEIPFPHTTVYWGKEISPLQLNISENSKNK
ncbi:MAG: mechanosensitive ion channel family protein [Bacteroidales bacterium]|nr:mechanosensitive ion channel family protein [Bacteroidales bacterium]